LLLYLITNSGVARVPAPRYILAPPINKNYRIWSANRCKSAEEAKENIYYSYFVPFLRAIKRI